MDRREIGGMGVKLGYCKRIGEKLGQADVKGGMNRFCWGEWPFFSFADNRSFCCCYFLSFVVHSVHG